MAFRKKAHAIIKEHPDVLVIEECECLDKINTDCWEIAPSDSYWYGNNSNKGVAIFTFNNYRLDLTSIEHDHRFQFVIPLTIVGNNESVAIYAVWTQKTQDNHYTWHIYRAVEHYAEKMTESNSIIIGDLNSNPIWDKPRRETNHSNLIVLLNGLEMVSAYHFLSGEQPGKERTPTLYFQRNRNKTYHIDYCFLSQRLINRSSKIVVGQCDDWINYSDHMPLIIDI